MSQAAEKPSYKQTLNLPKTGFAMKANLVQNEPASLKRWDEIGVYRRLRALGDSRPRFAFHDGPPYANGSIHLGHLMNKCLKDFVVRSRTMMGFDVPYVPGWDCHGLPIEHKVMTELLESGKSKKLEALEPERAKMAVRRACQEYAEKFVKLQSGQLRRLLTIGNYDEPYLTMTPSYEAAVLEVLAGLVERGLVYRALKPVHWSIANETALADAELEYQEREDLSVYVDFEAADAGAVYEAFGLSEDARPGQTPSFMIWTTTPWTLPANLAVAVHREFRYALVKVDGNVTVMAEKLVNGVTELAGSEDVEVLALASGSALVGLRYRHPFVVAPAGGDHGAVGEASWTLVHADYVTLEDGTGLVHTAPGHGTEDFQTGQREGLAVYCPVMADGRYDESVPAWLRGVSIWEANETITERLRESGHLFHGHRFMHSYPHDWRSKTPVIFRCTEQWFIAVDRPFRHDRDPEGPEFSLRQRALAAVDASAFGPTPPSGSPAFGDDGLAAPEGTGVDTRRARPSKVPGEYEGAGAPTGSPLGRGGPADLSAEPMGVDAAERARDKLGASLGSGPVRFVPEWGRNRMRGMLESRPDWCISRQRSWGLPIPSFVMSDGRAFMTAASVRAVAKLFAEEGSDAWFRLDVEALLRHYDPSSDPEGVADLDVRSLRKGQDILDVWFESGSSWNAVMRARVGADAVPVELYLEGSDQHRGWFQLSLLPALGVLGRPPYRALLTHGFCVDKDGRKLSKSAGHTIENLFEKYGADVLRWWVASAAYEGDVKVDDEFFAAAGESYRKVRNTLRFMLSNLYDVEGGGGDVAVEAGPPEPRSLEAWVLAEFDRVLGEVTRAYERFDFRRAQQAIYDFCSDTLSSVYLAAVKDRLYCDRADSPRRQRTQAALRAMTGGLCRLVAPVLCHTADEAWRAMPGRDGDACVHLEMNPKPTGAKPDAGWPRVMAVREEALKALERAKAERGIDNPMDAGLVLPDPDGTLAAFDADDLADLCGVSRASASREAAAVEVVDLRDQPRCDRSRKRHETVRPRSDGGMLTDRDAAAVGAS